MNFRKIGMTARAFAFASLSPKPNLDANDSTCWRENTCWEFHGFANANFMICKCMQMPEAVKQSLTPRTHQRKKVKGTSPHERDDEAMKERKRTKTMANTGQPRQA